MKLFSTVTVVLTAISGVSAGWSRAQLCQRQTPGIVHAIQTFCEGTRSLDVPSGYATRGARSGKPYAAWTVFITANCSPAQWVPKEYCYSQFYDMCPDAKRNGYSIVRKYGRNGCQQWTIISAYFRKRDEDAVNGNYTLLADGEEE